MKESIADQFRKVLRLASFASTVNNTSQTLGPAPTTSEGQSKRLDNRSRQVEHLTKDAKLDIDASEKESISGMCLASVLHVRVERDRLKPLYKELENPNSINSSANVATTNTMARHPNKVVHF
jgi:hypothetical protein